MSEFSSPDYRHVGTLTYISREFVCFNLCIKTVTFRSWKDAIRYVNDDITLDFEALQYLKVP